MEVQNSSKDVLIVGGGIAGCQASLDLAAAGYRVYLVEETSSIGGVMPMLGRTFPTNDCSLCILSPKLMECARHPLITVLTGTRLTALQGGPGDFRAELKSEGRGVDINRCTACGNCEKECGVYTDDEFNQGLSGRKAVYRRYAQALPAAFALDPGLCIQCEACVLACPVDAIDLRPRERLFQLTVGAVILSPGFRLADPAQAPGLRYRQDYPYVLTSLEFERLISSTGPTGGQLLHPLLGRPLRSAAWLQCAASRDPAVSRGFCSSVCCMYALKQAMVACEVAKEPFQAVIFYTDMRTFGKGFERYHRRAVDMGIRFVRCRASEAKRRGDQVTVRYVDEGGRVASASFDLAVLSLGMASPMNHPVAGLALGLNRWGFLEPAGYSAVETGQPGVFVAGAFSGPRDIPETVIQASAAAGAVAAVLGPSSESTDTARTESRPTAGAEDHEPPRVGVFVCSCGGNISNVLDVGALTEEARGLPGVVYATRFTYACGQDSLSEIKKQIVNHHLNRVVVAACTPRTHEPLFQETLCEAGLNAGLFEMANIREHCSWVHQGDSRAATAKAGDLLRMAVARVGLAEAVHSSRTPVIRTALVVGGGVAGMSAALALAGQGFPVHLVEREDRLGGMARRIRHGLKGENVPRFLTALVARVKAEGLITVHTGVHPVDSTGFVGQFTTLLSDGTSLTHGVTILATGAQEGQPPAAWGRHPRILTQLALDQALAEDDNLCSEPQDVVFIQCAGSRDNDHPWCSRVCCNKAVRLALVIKERHPQNRVFILYRDMVTYGFFEEYYTRAREAGVIFVRYDHDRPPRITEGPRGLEVEVEDTVLSQRLVLPAGLVCLAPPVEPGPDTRELARLFRAGVDEDGFFLEAHRKLRPVDFSTDGVFMAGCAHGPKNIEESVAQGKAAAARAAAILTRDALTVEGKCAVVNKTRCSACGLCEMVCPAGAVALDRSLGTAVVNEILCKGCGACAASCRSGALDLKGCMDEQIMAMLEAI